MHTQIHTPSGDPTQDRHRTSLCCRRPHLRGPGAASGVEAAQGAASPGAASLARPSPSLGEVGRGQRPGISWRWGGSRGPSSPCDGEGAEARGLRGGGEGPRLGISRGWGGAATGEHTWPGGVRALAPRGGVGGLGAPTASPLEDPSAPASSRELTDLDLHALENPEPLFLHRHAGSARNSRAEPRGAAEPERRRSPGALCPTPYPRVRCTSTSGSAHTPAHWPRTRVGAGRLRPRPCPVPDCPRPAEGRERYGSANSASPTAHWLRARRREQDGSAHIPRPAAGRGWPLRRHRRGPEGASRPTGRIRLGVPVYLVGGGGDRARFAGGGDRARVGGGGDQAGAVEPGREAWEGGTCTGF